MAFLPTMSLFLLAAVNNAAEDPVVAESEVDNTEGELEEEIIADEPAEGAFAECIAETIWAADDAKNGPLTAWNTCENTFAFEECLTYPAAAKKCCPQVCNSEHICAGEEFKNVSGGPVDENGSNDLTECLENTFWPSPYAFWKWGATWRKSKYETCELVYAAGYTPQNDISVALCCPNQDTSTEEPVAEEGSPAAEEEVAARMLAEDDADIEAEAEAEGEGEAEAEAEVSAKREPRYGKDLRDAMCVGGKVTTNAPVDPNASTTTKAPNGGGKDNNGSASTFGFTALALMLVTA